MTVKKIDFDQLSQCLNRGGDMRPTSDFDLNNDAPPKQATLRPAAVLLPLIRRPAGISLILTTRAAALKHHAGQVAFPGGKIEPDDPDAQSAALREADEEIGLSTNLVTPIGGLVQHQTVTGFQVHPFVARVDPDFQAKPDPGEVAEVFEVPLAHVLNPENFRVEGRLWQGKLRRYYVVPYGPYYIWGATARMLRMFASQLEENHAYSR